MLFWQGLLHIFSKQNFCRLNYLTNSLGFDIITPKGGKMFIIFSGVSASGKNTVMQELSLRDKRIKILELSSGTTRTPRETDKDNNTYVFMSREEFENRIQNGDFFEYENVHGNYYGILNSAIDKVIQNQNVDFIRDIDVHGREKIVKYFADKCPVVTIFLDAPDSELEKRLRSRGESEQQIKVRLARSALERKFKKDYDLVIENIDMAETIEKILIFVSEKRKTI